MLSARLLPTLALALLSLACMLHFVAAAPTTAHSISQRAVQQVSVDVLESFAPYTQFARAAYCGAQKAQTWSCGEACDAIPDFQPMISGGDGNAIQYYFVGYWPSQNTIVVAHEGTDPLKFKSLLTDLKFALVKLDPEIFPGVPSNVLVHDGFASTHSKTAANILKAVKQLLQKHTGASVTLVGHSLGGALAELDSLMLSLQLPAGTSINGVTYGTPRTGNDAYSAYFSSKVSNFMRVNNLQDPIPTLPPIDFGYKHVAQEIHILGKNHAVMCPGAEDTTDDQCTDQLVPTILLSNILNHLGPYQGIYIGTIFCY